MNNHVLERVDAGHTIDIFVALQSLCEGAEWTIRGVEYKDIIWHKPPSNIPSEEDVQAEIERLKALAEQRKYRRQRRGNYKSIEEQLDMLYWDKINDTTIWQDHITDIKNTHPKPNDA